MRLRSIASVTCLFLLALVAGCDGGVVIANRSGTVNDDYVEEPISNRSKRYENALLVSNAVIDKLRSAEYHAIHQEFFDPQFQATLDEPKFIAMMKQVELHLGPIKRYKPMQWGFVPRQEAGKNILYSTKIVEHEKGMMNYFFVFTDDGKYQKLAGIHARVRTGTTLPGQL
jgi:hypothetical protein